ncbi:Uncharacterised protein [Plesiomonas shigelloides]|jgi:gentisate 1,2-dioxygenase|uniref:DNA-binding protein H-NS-like N-terminal domain-containing protein n=2 Tax=Plesiomonas shigelloides TaxID=703 RepID=R8AS31_PLESH|nr:hypothetical protein C7R88_10995 [Plesiomonas shigelloides]EON89118.1 hypothetical protein PLESHI_07114 [Plesiomonas shigelloides 302-73]MCX9457656.1 hypothetical protein [Vibrio cholerae]KAB7653350.1 hypothetical protein GBN14_15035 [Plesiomonas shigelloides]KAB7660339.1 hypothetical protein GBN25_16560 [Plesiomonas shigelloides]
MSSFTTFEMAKIMNQLEDSPEKVMFGRVLKELCHQSPERIRSAARHVDIKELRDLVHQVSAVIEEKREERKQQILRAMAAEGINPQDLLES